MSNWPKQSGVTNFYGDPRGENGNVNHAWVAANIVRVAAPWQMVTAWDGRPVSAVQVHRLCADSLRRVFAAIWLAAKKNQATIEFWGMDKFAGGYNYRLMRGGNQLSMHSWGCAVDFDSARNALGNQNPSFKYYPDVRAAFAAEGWVWGGEWSVADGMHWQAATV